MFSIMLNGALQVRCSRSIFGGSHALGTIMTLLQMGLEDVVNAGVGVIGGLGVDRGAPPDLESHPLKVLLLRFDQLYHRRLLVQ